MEENEITDFFYILLSPRSSINEEMTIFVGILQAKE